MSRVPQGWECLACRERRSPDGIVGTDYQLSANRGGLDQEGQDPTIVCDIDVKVDEDAPLGR